MCHMFLVPVFETGSLRTFQLSPHTEAVRAGRRGEDTEKTHKDRERGREKEDEKDARTER